MQETINQLQTIHAGLTDSTKEVFETVSKLECIKDLFLCGGTGISIQLNHRLSEDLDFELIGTRKERPQLDFGGIIREIKTKFPDANEELIGNDQFLIYINNRNVKLSFFRPKNPVKTIDVGLQYNNLKAPTLQNLLGMKTYALCVRTVFRDYYDIYCLLEKGMQLDEAISYASYLSRHQIRSKTMYTRLLSPQLFPIGDDFKKLSPKYDITPQEIRDRVKKAIESA